MWGRRDAFLDTYAGRPSGQSTSHYSHQRENRQRARPGSDEPLIVRYPGLEGGNSSGTSTRGRPRSRERRREYSQNSIRVAIDSTSSHRRSGDYGHPWGEDSIGVAYASPRPNGPSHASPAGADTYDSPRPNSRRSQPYETEREWYPRYSTRDVRLPYPPDTSPPPADSIARQFHRLTIADSWEDNCE